MAFEIMNSIDRKNLHDMYDYDDFSYCNDDVEFALSFEFNNATIKSDNEECHGN